MSKLLDIYNTLLDYFGPQNWWPGETSFEVMVGAVLTQNTNWNNVSRAVNVLKKEKLLTLEALSGLPVESLAIKIKPAGYYNLKAARLKNLLDFINHEYNGRIEDFQNEEIGQLREQLLKVKGIGPETADSILLYAADKPVFVVDAYTHRILFRHALIAEDDHYHDIQTLFMDSLPPDVSLFNEYHALLVRLGKEFCKKNNPLCSSCPIENI